MAALLAVFTLLLPAAARAAPPSLVTSTFSGATWHDNATNADRPADILGAFEFIQEVSGTWRWSLGRDDAVFLGPRARIELWPRYDGLDRTAAGVHLGWQHKFGLGAQAPALRVDLLGDDFSARENARSGRAGSATVSLRKRWGDFLRLQVSHEFHRYDGKAHAFDRTVEETTAAINADLGPAWRVTLTGRYRKGGVLSYATPPHPVLLKGGKALTTVTTFDRDAPMIAYYFMARTNAVRIEFGRNLGPRSELALALERRVTTNGPISYVNRPVSLSLTHNF